MIENNNDSFAMLCQLHLPSDEDLDGLESVVNDHRKMWEILQICWKVALAEAAAHDQSIEKHSVEIAALRSELDNVKKEFEVAKNALLNDIELKEKNVDCISSHNENLIAIMMKTRDEFEHGIQEHHVVQSGTEDANNEEVVISDSSDDEIDGDETIMDIDKTVESAPAADATNVQKLNPNASVIAEQITTEKENVPPQSTPIVKGEASAAEPVNSAASIEPKKSKGTPLSLVRSNEPASPCASSKPAIQVVKKFPCLFCVEEFTKRSLVQAHMAEHMKKKKKFGHPGQLIRRTISQKRKRVEESDDDDDDNTGEESKQVTEDDEEGNELSRSKKRASKLAKKAFKPPAYKKK